MNGIISVLAIAVAVCQGVSIVTGPTGTTQEIGATFKLKCSVQGKTDSDTVFWTLFPVNSGETKRLSFDSKSLIPAFYEIETGTYNLIVKNATYLDDGTFECEAGTDKKSARVYIYDKPESLTFDWEHSINKPGSVNANQEYKLICTSKHSHPPATHRYFKNGVELNKSKINYTYNNDTDTDKGYGDVTSTLPFTPSKDDVSSMNTIRCVIDLYNKKNVSSIAFAINSAQQVCHFGLGAALMVVMSFLCKN